MKKLYTIYVNGIGLFILLIMLSCGGNKLSTESGVYLSELDLYEASLIQQIENPKMSSTNSKDLMAELGAVQGQIKGFDQELLSRKIPKLPPVGPCNPISNCPHMLFKHINLITPLSWKNITLQILDDQGKVINEAKGEFIFTPKLKEYSVFKIHFDKNLKSDKFDLLVMKTDNKGTTSKYKVSFQEK